MLLPNRVKHRKQHRGRMKGRAMRGNTIVHGEFGLVALEPAWITNRQIEAARIAMTRYVKRGGQVWIQISRTNRLPQNLQKPVWVPAKALLNTGLPSLNPVVSCLKWAA